VARTNPDVARTRALWTANKPGETAAPAYVPDPPVWWHVAFALAAALLVQSSLAPWLQFRGARVSLVTLVIAWYALRTGTLHGLTFGLIAGSCEDALAGSTGVAWTFASAFVGLLCGRLARTWLADTKIALVPGAAAATLVRDCTFFVVMQAQGPPLALPVAHFHAMLWQCALDALVALVALQIFPQLGSARAHRR
jgi:rod shape-determining protein MreD